MNPQSGMYPQHARAISIYVKSADDAMLCLFLDGRPYALDARQRFFPDAVFWQHWHAHKNFPDLCRQEISARFPAVATTTGHRLRDGAPFWAFSPQNKEALREAGIYVFRDKKRVGRLKLSRSPHERKDAEIQKASSRYGGAV